MTEQFIEPNTPEEYYINSVERHWSGAYIPWEQLREDTKNYWTELFHKYEDRNSRSRS